MIKNFQQHFQTKKFYGIYLIFVFIFILCSGRVNAKDSDVFLVIENKSAEDLKRYLENFSDSKFDGYLNDVSHYGAEEYHTAICNLFIKYKKCFSDLNDCSSKSHESEKKYSDIWVKDLLNRFGVEYITNNLESMKSLILNINFKNFSLFCIDVEKEGLYWEIQYIITVREYFQNYLEFYETLDTHEKQLYAEKKKTAEDISKLVSEYPFQIMMYGNRLRTFLDVNYKVFVKPEVIEFMINHPELSKPFSPLRAFKDLAQACGKGVDNK
ncbi:MAG: hypothetical protein KKD44_01975 [Proteobacteria bacterium]|nr:hypothetical protein [Pseudomonadota bacterium]